MLFPTLQMHNFLTYNDLTLAFKKFGTGPKVALAFHGFGQSSDEFRIFKPILGNEYTIFSFDLFHHGKSAFPENRIEKDTFTKAELKAIFDLFFEQNPCTRTLVIGYSLGGKISLIMVELFPTKIKRLWLFAPDGIKKNFWYHFASNTFVGNRIYKHFLRNPDLFFTMVDSLHKAGLINEKLKKFAFNNMDDAEKRELVYKVWSTFKKVNPDIRKVASLIRENNIAVCQYFGKYDKVIKPGLGKWFAKKIGQENRLFILEAGHVLLTEKTVDFIKIHPCSQ